jgi:hypothetical protein
MGFLFMWVIPIAAGVAIPSLTSLVWWHGILIAIALMLVLPMVVDRVLRLVVPAHIQDAVADEEMFREHDMRRAARRRRSDG